MMGSRFIPAYAGNSPNENRVRNLLTVHPRLRGELELTGTPAPNGLGSSPLTRGTLFDGFFPGVQYRFIPAYAGNSSWKTTAERLCSVHPRLRGELEEWAKFVNYCRGSSPLTRGTRNIGAARPFHLSLTPKSLGP